MMVLKSFSAVGVVTAVAGGWGLDPGLVSFLFSGLAATVSGLLTPLSLPGSGLILCAVIKRGMGMKGMFKKN